MNEETAVQPWVQRFAQRIQRRHTVGADEAVELARQMHAALGGAGCPERVADELFGQHVLA